MPNQVLVSLKKRLLFAVSSLQNYQLAVLFKLFEVLGRDMMHVLRLADFSVCRIL